MASDAPVVPTTKHTCGARDPKGRPCQGVPSIPCPKCLLVAYCGPECRERHWATKHKHACLVDMVAKPRKIDLEVDEEATMYSNSPWSSSAATDVLNLEKNEGRFFDDYLQLLFTGEVGLRHLIYSVDKMPETASPMLSVCINETNHFNLTRTLFAIHLLFSHDHDPVLNAEAVIHLWYSSRMPKALHDHINSVVRKHIIYTLDDISCYYGSEELSEAQPCRSHTSQVNFSMDVELKRADWMAVKKRLDVSSVGLAESVVLRFLDKARNTEAPERVLARMTRARWAGLRKWHEDGLLLPYGHPRDGFDTLNPLFFVGKDKFPVGATTEPLSEWPMEVLDYEGCAAPNDVYGKMFWYLRDLLVRFQRRIAKISVKMLLTCESGRTLPDWLPTLKLDREFDRIEVGALWDQHPFLTLGLFSKLLRHEEENPYATMLTLTRDSVTHDMSCVQANLDAENLDMRRPTNTVLDEYAPPVDSDDPMKRDAIRRKMGLLMWRNWDKFSSRFLNSPTHFAFASLLHRELTLEHRSVIQTGFLGLAVREKHMITRRWPNRLVHSKKDKPSLRDFNRWLGWPDMVPERWLEWKRREELPEVEWLNWLGLAGSQSRLGFELQLEDIVLGYTSDDESGDGLEKAMDGVALDGVAQEGRGTLDYDSEATIDANDWAAEVQLKADEDELKKAEAEEAETLKDKGKKKSKKSKKSKK